MSYYFGFLPSTSLSDTIDDAYALIKNNRGERYDVYRDKITHLINQELLDIMLVKLIESLPDNSERKQHLIKVSHTIEATTDKLINTVLSPTTNDLVLPSFEFLDKNVLKTDLEGKLRISVPLSDALATQLLASFDNVQQGNGKHEVENLTRLFDELTKACLQHFLLDFSKTLPLSRLKRGAIPIADSVINKALSLALHRLIPQLPTESLAKFTSYYQPLIFESHN
ncbi:hypothetical protein MOMA_07121 [Moraxella macacae 0408225]|uniref:Uncharacterized protein n=1 Tax=Moraxella macacae 0408225 TaxID=1230338 RepID=L2F5H8_9GAMM|nr:hypothetical protein [Moraxella macacae]ELA08314.1 hypothetical protein MOMA_07121 [Moraxella macacae 0408225]